MISWEIIFYLFLDAHTFHCTVVCMRLTWECDTMLCYCYSQLSVCLTATAGLTAASTGKVKAVTPAAVLQYYKIELFPILVHSA